MTKCVLFINGASQDPRHAYFGWPTSLLYAIGPSVEAMRTGQLDMLCEPELFDTGKWISPIDDVAIFAAFDERLANVDILCASATYDSLWPVLRLFQRAKNRKPEVVTLLGGPHVDEIHELGRFNDADIHHDIVDYAIAGDAELALLALLRGLATGKDGPVRYPSKMPEGVFSTYHHGQRIDGGGRPLELDALSPIQIELADTASRRSNLARLLCRPDLSPVVETIAQRGCVYACECCSERRIPLNHRSIDSIIAEVDLRKRQGFQVVFFSDSTFGKYRPLPDLLRELRRTGMKFGCLNRFDLLANPTLLNAYKEAGFAYFYCAIEQYDDSVLRGITKAENTAQIKASMALLHDLGFMLGVSLLYGLPGESRGSIERTLDFVGEWVDRGLIRLVSQSALSLRPAPPLGRKFGKSFDSAPPHRGFPFDAFEEGHWYHLPQATEQHLEWIANESHGRFGNVLVRRSVDAGEDAVVARQPCSTR